MVQTTVALVFIAIVGALLPSAFASPLDLSGNADLSARKAEPQRGRNDEDDVEAREPQLGRGRKAIRDEDDVEARDPQLGRGRKAIRAEDDVEARDPRLGRGRKAIRSFDKLD
ncbi:hypothetical protein FA15DRAFT_708563 [Coprinopsis marcescibilis]|uniref:Uncharacterized protein n=1 Tax=Coprinopsis marcescibilis TaxID=230819 RepID=A0A5C3KIE4_COPMA|nr:hypothetical protein FA15DRAFT_708563 [Coprinopsis marcescibilis]